MTDEQKELLIAMYLVKEFSGGKYCSDQTLASLTKTTPYPEIAGDLLRLVRALDKHDSIFETLSIIYKESAQP